MKIKKKLARAERAIEMGRSGLGGNHLRDVLVPELENSREAVKNLTANLAAKADACRKLGELVEFLDGAIRSSTVTLEQTQAENRELLAQVTSADEVIEALVESILKARDAYEVDGDVLCDDVQSIIDVVTSARKNTDCTELAADGTDVSVRHF